MIFASIPNRSAKNPESVCAISVSFVCITPLCGPAKQQTLSVFLHDYTVPVAFEPVGWGFIPRRDVGNDSVVASSFAFASPTLSVGPSSSVMVTAALAVPSVAPEGDDVRQLSEAEARARFSEIGGADASTSGGPHPLMHRTETVDYGIVISGEITLVLDKGEANLKAGDVVIQRGTNHAWANRSGKPCRMLFMLVDGQFSDEVNPSKAGS